MENRENGRMRMEREEPKGERKGGGKFEDVMIGRNAVSEALRVGRQIDSILVARDACSCGCGAKSPAAAVPAA